MILVGSFFTVQASTLEKFREIKAIIFDYDGTLIDNGASYFLVWQHVLNCQGYELNPDDFWDVMNKTNLGGSPKADHFMIPYCCALVGRECRNELLRDRNIFSKNLYDTTDFPAVEHTLNFLHALGKSKETLGLKIGLASANSRANILLGLKRLKIDHYFEVIVSASDLSEYSDPDGVNKPKAYIYQKAAKLLVLHPSECVAIEDSHTGISSAVSAGCVAVAVPNAYTKNQDLSHAHLKMVTFEEVTPTDFLQIISDYDLSLEKNSELINF